MFIFQVIIEVLAVCLIAYGVWHEDELAGWERRTWHKIKRRWKS